jgi:hypothetical protein
MVRYTVYVLEAIGFYRNMHIATCNHGQLGISLTFPPFMDGVKTWSHTSAAHVPVLAQTLDTMPVTFAILGLRPSFK